MVCIGATSCTYSVTFSSEPHPYTICPQGTACEIDTFLLRMHAHTHPPHTPTHPTHTHTPHAHPHTRTHTHTPQGEYIDWTSGVSLGISTMAAAGLGNLISDLAGLGLADQVEAVCLALGIPNPNLSPSQRTHQSSRWMALLVRRLSW